MREFISGIHDVQRVNEILKAHNHFFIRGRLLEEFLRRLDGRHVRVAGVEVMTDMLSAGGVL